MSAVSLSDLPRAALAAKEGYWWINGIALSLSAVIAWMSWSAYGDDGQHDRALVCIVAQALAIALAILARRALTGQMPVSAVIAGGLAAGCAWWASHGLALAWYEDAERNSEPMVIFMAALEPALFLLAEHVKEGRETLRAAVEKADRETAEELAAIRARNENQPPRPTERRLELVETPAPPVDAGALARAVGGSMVVAAASTGSAAALPADAADVQLPLLLPEAHSESTWASPDAHARHLIQHEGVKQRNVLARRVRGLTAYRAAQLLDELAPGWSAKRAAVAA